MSTQLLHGDCYEIIPTLPDNSIDLIVTDPPFKFQTAGGSLYKKQASRAKTLAQLENLECCDFSPKDFLDLLFPKMKMFYGYFFCNKLLIADYLNWAIEHNFKFDLLTMNKKNPVPAKNGHHLNDLEYIVLIREPGSYFDSKQSYDDYRKYFETVCAKRIHPAEKPVELLERFVRVSCPKNGLVFDPFAGSGSTGIACLNNRRSFIGCEKDDSYFELANKRIKAREDELNGIGTLFEGIA